MHPVFHKAPYTRFMEFIDPASDRYNTLVSVLNETGLPFSPLDVNGNKHIIVFPENAAVGKNILIMTAHYDRTPGSQGANDNGASVFMLIESALRIKAKKESGENFLIVFTDKEELQTGQSLEEQGSYSLALYLKEKGLGNARIFIFDACGAGDTIIISTAADTLLNAVPPQAAGSRSESSTLRRRIQKLRGEALEAARKARLEKVMLLPTPFSEDAGFLKAGLCAQTITVLPAPEAAAFAALARSQGETASALLSSGAALPADRRLIPETWRSLNGPGDSHLRLSPENWKNLVVFAGALWGVTPQ
jgi:hypothetical protein